MERSTISLSTPRATWKRYRMWCCGPTTKGQSLSGIAARCRLQCCTFPCSLPCRCCFLAEQCHDVAIHQVEVQPLMTNIHKSPLEPTFFPCDSWLSDAPPTAPIPQELQQARLMGTTAASPSWRVLRRSAQPLPPSPPPGPTTWKYRVEVCVSLCPSVTPRTSSTTLLCAVCIHRFRICGSGGFAKLETPGLRGVRTSAKLALDCPESPWADAEDCGCSRFTLRIWSWLARMRKSS